MSRPGTIVTFSSLATAVIGLAVSTGAARLTTSEDGPLPVASPPPTGIPSVERPDSTPRASMAIDGLQPSVESPASASNVVPEIVFRSPGPRSEPLSSAATGVASSSNPIVAEPVELPGRRRPASSVSGVRTEGGLLVGDDHAPQVGEIRYFNGRPIRAARTMRMRVTAYSPDHRSCGVHADGITASGFSVDVNGGRLVAADRRLFPFGALVSVPGYASGQVVPVLDRGGAIKGSRLDVLYPTHEIARRWGVQHVDVMVWEYADGQPIGYKRPRGR